MDDNFVRFRNKNLIPALLKKGRSYRDIAKKFGISASRVGAIKKELEEEKNRNEKWGNIPVRVVNNIRNAFHCESFKEFVEKSLTRDQVLMAKGIGKIAVRELEKAGAFKHSLPPAILFDDEIPSPQFVTKARHYLNALLNPGSNAELRKMAMFIDLVVKSGGKLQADNAVVRSEIPCMTAPQRKWCKGILKILRTSSRFHWWCPECGKSGVVTDYANWPEHSR